MSLVIFRYPCRYGWPVVEIVRRDLVAVIEFDSDDNTTMDLARSMAFQLTIYCGDEPLV